MFRFFKQPTLTEQEVDRLQAFQQAYPNCTVFYLLRTWIVLNKQRNQTVAFSYAIHPDLATVLDVARHALEVAHNASARGD